MIKKNHIILFTITCLCALHGCAILADITQQPVLKSSDSVEHILAKLNESTAKLQSYQCTIRYLFEQPLFESRTLRLGRLYYLRDGTNSMLRVDFESIQQDDDPPQKYLERYLFDGIWLTRVDYQLKQVKKYQLVDPNQIDPNQGVDAFDLITEHLPIVGFTKTEKLAEHFEIQLIRLGQAEPNDRVNLHMKVKPDSIYADDYTAIDFVIDKSIYLPVSITAFSVEQEIYRLDFLDPEINHNLERKIFRLEIPDGFGKPEIIPYRQPKRVDNR